MNFKTTRPKRFSNLTSCSGSSHDCLIRLLYIFIDNYRNLFFLLPDTVVGCLIALSFDSVKGAPIYLLRNIKLRLVAGIDFVQFSQFVYCHKSMYAITLFGNNNIVPDIGLVSTICI